MKTISLEMTRRERTLAREHGYPFKEVRAALDAVESEPGTASIVADSYWLELLVGDLSRSCNDCADHQLAVELDELCLRLEFELGLGH